MSVTKISGAVAQAPKSRMSVTLRLEGAECNALLVVADAAGLEPATLARGLLRSALQEAYSDVIFSGDPDRLREKLRATWRSTRVMARHRGDEVECTKTKVT